MEPQPPVATAPTPQPSPIPPKPKNNSFLIILLSVSLLLATSLAFFFALQTQKLAKQLAILQIQPTPIASPKPLAEAETTNWKTYTNQKHGFNFKYPGEIFVKETGGENLPLIYLDTKPIEIPEVYGHILTPVEIRTSPLIKEATIEKRITNLKKSEFFNPESLSEKAISEPKGVILSGTVKGPAFAGLKLTYVYFQGENEIIEVLFDERENFSQELFDRILSTFRFTE